MAGLDVAPRAQVPRADWDLVVEQSDDGWLWHRHGFQDVLATWPRRTDASFAVTRGDAIVGVVPAHVVERRVSGIAVRRIDVFGGPCLLEQGADVVDATRRGLLDLARRRRAIHVTAARTPLAPAERDAGGAGSLAPFGFDDQGEQAWVVDTTQAPDEVWRGIQSRTRTYVQKARRAGATVRDAVPADLDRYYELHLETAARTGATPHPRAYFEAIWRDVVPTGAAHGLVVEHDGAIVSACNIAVAKQTATYWTAASTAAAQSLHANDLLMASLLAWAAEQGLRAVDLGDAHLTAGTDKHHRISAFKRKFGGELRPLRRGRLVTATGWRRPIVAAVERRAVR